MFEKLTKRVHDIGLVPVVAIDDAADAEALGNALTRGGVMAAEVTFRTSAGEQAMRVMAEKVPDLLVGAGTVTSVDLAELAVDAGAKFIVSPGLNPSVVSWCVDHEIPVIPGISTPSEIEEAMGFGLEAVKFFPAEASGGVSALKAFSGPYASMRFLPTGGINEKNMVDYLRLPNVLAVGGSWMVPKGLVAKKDFDAIAGICERSVLRMHSFSLAHVGINCDDADEALQVAQSLGTMFGLPVVDKGGGYFAGDMADVVKTQLLGSKGHIGINCIDVDRAKAWFERRGYHFVETGAGRDARGYVSIFFEGEVGGFAIHLRRA